MSRLVFVLLLVATFAVGHRPEPQQSNTYAGAHDIVGTINTDLDDDEAFLQYDELLNNNALSDDDSSFQHVGGHDSLGGGDFDDLTRSDHFNDQADGLKGLTGFVLN